MNEINITEVPGNPELQVVDGLPFVVVPQGHTVHAFTERLANPFRVKQAVALATVAAFILYVNRFADKHTVVFVDVPNGNIKAVIDYHKAEAYEQDDTKASPRHGGHVVTLRSSFTPEFQKIKDASGKKFNQEEFALFLEDVAPHINTPDAATMQEIVTTLQAKTGVDFKSSIRLDNGQASIAYNETIESKAGTSGNLTVPQSITFGVKVHRGGNAYALPARFRFRITGGNLVFWYDIDQLDAAIERSMQDTVDVLKNGILIDPDDPETGFDVPPVTAHIFEGTVTS